jgi:hypothetical protein
MERLQDEGPLRFRDADALVVDCCDEPVALDRCPEDDRRTIGSVLEGVSDEVLENATDPARVDVDRRQVRGKVDDEARVVAG